MNGTQVGLGTGIDLAQHIITGRSLSGPSLRFEIMMDQGICVAVAHTKVPLEQIADFTMFRETAFTDDGEELIECLAGPGLNVLKLRLEGLVDSAHGIPPRGQ